MLAEILYETADQLGKVSESIIETKSSGSSSDCGGGGGGNSCSASERSSLTKTLRQIQSRIKPFSALAPHLREGNSNRRCLLITTWLIALVSDQYKFEG